MKMIKTRKKFWTGPRAFAGIVISIVLIMGSIPLAAKWIERHERVDDSALERAFRKGRVYPEVARMVKKYTADGELLRWEMSRIEALADRCYARVQAIEVKRLSDSLEIEPEIPLE